jgi:hypothetical protein
MIVEQQMSVNVSVMILFLFPNVNLVIKKITQCVSLAKRYSRLDVQLPRNCLHCPKKIRADDLVLHTY